MPVGQPLGTQPKPLAIVGQKFQRRARTVAKDIDGSTQGIIVQHLATERREPVDALPKVDGLHGQKDATLGRELEHQRGSKKMWTKAARAEGAVSGP
jgi:hypothetical protein